MNSFVARLAVHVPSYYFASTGPVPALEISGSGYLSMTSDTLYITSNGIAQSYDLYNISVSQLANQIASDQGSGPTYFIGGVEGSMLKTSMTPTLLQDGMVELLSLPDGQTSEILPATLYLPSDGLYFLLGARARMLETAKRQMESVVAQINLQAAQTTFLDWWGASVGIPRYQGEPDVLYAQRIIGMRFRPTQNEYSIMRLFKTLGYTATVTNTSSGAFSVNVTVPTSPPNGFVYTLAQLQDILNQVKSAGYQGTVVAQASLSDSVAVTDSVSATLNSSTWTVGNVTVGQFNI